jgi:3-oxoacyl-[acyl-carrier protein] reductase
MAMHFASVILFLTLLSSCTSLQLAKSGVSKESKSNSTASLEQNNHISLNKKVAVVVGASSGIGKEIALTFAKAKAQVVLFARREELLKNNVSEIIAVGGQATYVVGDTSKLDDIQRLINATVAAYGKIDILCFNAAIFEGARLENLSADSFERVIKTNLTGAFYAVKNSLDLLARDGEGRIIFISSISGPRVGYPGLAHYTASKAGLNGFMKTIAIEVAKRGITVNAIEPGSIATEVLEALPKEKKTAMLKAIPMNRLGTSQEIANIALFLASSMSSFITGQSIIADGGQLLPESHHFTY